ncbi:hypothetical protein L596_020397 [Steinernema carpocapsae]|uniref:Uncharacterized protein n=1 Tax=Steinernema carpocapsae TaxID=34508 RepID=A0A4U5MU68_STECR|nr:hypothetical protein L596_020397 [Steinernema carpocapsae]
MYTADWRLRHHFRRCRCCKTDRLSATADVNALNESSFSAALLAQKRCDSFSVISVPVSAKKGRSIACSVL